MLPPRQYYLTSTRPETVPEGYRARSVGDWQFIFDESYDSVPVVDDDEYVGRLIGTIVDVRGQCTDGELRLSEAGSGGDSDSNFDSAVAAFEDALSDLAGHYVALLDADGPLLYTDPIGGFPVVYDSAEGVAGATPAALPNVDHRARFRAELFDRLNHDTENIWLPGKRTYYSDVERLLPNHRLDLQSWETTRYWPSDSESLSTSDDSSAIPEFVGDTLREIFAEIVATYDRTVVPATAGQDSRTLLAGARPWLLDGDVATITWDPGERYDVDVELGRRMSTDLGFDWTPVRTVTATESEKQRWLELTGHAVGGTIMDIHPTLETFEADVHVNGFGGEVARGYFWEDDDDRDTSLDASEILHRLHKPEDPVLEDAVDEWLAGVSTFDTFAQLDLLYQELRLGCWGGPHLPGLARHRDVVVPLSYRPILDAMYRLPPEVRRNERLAPAIVDHCWPELNEYPYNTYDDWRDYVRKAKELRTKTEFAIARPGLAYSFVARKISGK